MRQRFHNAEINPSAKRLKPRRWVLDKSLTADYTLRARAKKSSTQQFERFTGFVYDCNHFFQRQLSIAALAAEEFAKPTLEALAKTSSPLVYQVFETPLRSPIPHEQYIVLEAEEPRAPSRQDAFFAEFPYACK
jgi:hypothetical protein